MEVFCWYNRVSVRWGKWTGTSNWIPYILQGLLVPQVSKKSGKKRAWQRVCIHLITVLFSSTFLKYTHWNPVTLSLLSREGQSHPRSKCKKKWRWSRAWLESPCLYVKTLIHSIVPIIFSTEIWSPTNAVTHPRKIRKGRAGFHSDDRK